jgi:hypothetical protein
LGSSRHPCSPLFPPVLPRPSSSTGKRREFFASMVRPCSFVLQPMPRTPQFPSGRSRPDADIIEMTPGLSHDHPFQLLAMGTDFTLDYPRDEIERDVPLGLQRPPGHQDHPGRPDGRGFSCTVITSLSEIPASFQVLAGKNRVLPVLPVCAGTPGDTGGTVLFTGFIGFW